MDARSPKSERSPRESKVVRISAHGFWLLLDGTEYFLPFVKFPWFRGAHRSQISDVELLHEGHLCWPTLDIDLSLDIIEDPDKYRLAYQ